MEKITATELKAMTKKPNKLRNVPTTVDGIKFHSKGEAKRYGELKLLQKAGKISKLVTSKKELRWRWKIVWRANDREFVRSQYYESDFSYFENGVQVVEDYKGMLTPEYKRKRRIMKELFGITIRETRG